MISPRVHPSLPGRYGRHPGAVRLGRNRGVRQKRTTPIMKSSPQRSWVRWFVGPSILVSFGSVLGCAGGEEVTPEALEAARRLWKHAGIHNYNMEWTVTGPNNAHYFVTVRDGEVRKLQSVRPDGARFELHSGQPRYFSVNGLFLTIANELALLKTERPFGQPKGTKVLLRFEPDSKWGYPHWYRRDVMGAPQGMRIDVVRLVPTSGNREVAPP